MTIGCAILAGGKSSRMGTNKAFLKIGNQTFLERIAEELDGFGEKLLSVGTNCEWLESEAVQMEKQGWKLISDIYPDHGPIGGIHAALKACQTDALFIATCDMPLIRVDLVEKLCRIIEDDQKYEYDAVIAVGEHGKVNPLCGVYRTSTISVFAKHILFENNRMMALLEKLNVKYVELETPEYLKQLTNVNTEEEYRTMFRL